MPGLSPAWPSTCMTQRFEGLALHCMRAACALTLQRAALLHSASFAPDHCTALYLTWALPKWAAAAGRQQAQGLMCATHLPQERHMGRPLRINFLHQP